MTELTFQTSDAAIQWLADQVGTDLDSPDEVAAALLELARRLHPAIAGSSTDTYAKLAAARDRLILGDQAPRRARHTRAETQRAYILDAERGATIRYHRAGDSTWDAERRRLTFYTACGNPIPGMPHRGAALPRWRAQRIAEPCRRCYPEAHHPTRRPA